MTRIVFTSVPSPEDAKDMLWIRPTGVVAAPQVSCVEMEKTNAATEKQPSCSSSNTSESTRLADLLNRKIQRRLRQQKEVHKIDKELGDMMRLFRTNTGVTLAALAYTLNLPFKYLYDIEQGIRSAALLDLVTIFSAYGIPIMQQIVEVKRART